MIVACIGSFVVALALSAAQTAESPDFQALAAAQQSVFRDALRVISPAVVKIETIGGTQPIRQSDNPAARAAAPDFRQADGPTTGVVWSSDGYIVTSSFNFIREPSVITVILHDRQRYVARIVARDRPGRLALLKIDVPADTLTPPIVAPTEAIRPGAWALAAGYGHGSAAPAVTVGIVSAINRVNGLAIQTDAKISPANYGGPLFDVQGRLMGVCVPTAGGTDDIAGVEHYDSGIAFAVAAARVDRHFARLKRGEDVERGFLGVVLAPEDATATGASATSAQTATSAPDADSTAHAGLRIGSEPRGSALTAGLKLGDVITHLDDAPTPRLLELRRVLWAKAAGDEIEVTYRRGDQRATATLTLSKEDQFSRPPSTAPASTQPR